VFGWTPAGSAETKAEARAEAAVLGALKKENSWQRDAFVIKQGWATMSGAETPGRKVAIECANRIITADGL